MQGAKWVAAIQQTNSLATNLLMNKLPMASNWSETKKSG